MLVQLSDNLLYYVSNVPIWREIWRMGFISWLIKPMKPAYCLTYSYSFVMGTGTGYAERVADGICEIFHRHTFIDLKPMLINFLRAPCTLPTENVPWKNFLDPGKPGVWGGSLSRSEARDDLIHSLFISFLVLYFFTSFFKFHSNSKNFHRYSTCIDNLKRCIKRPSCERNKWRKTWRSLGDYPWCCLRKNCEKKTKTAFRGMA